MATPTSKIELPEHLQSASPELQMLFSSMAEQGADLQAIHETPSRPFTSEDGLDKLNDEFVEVLQAKA